MGKTIVVYFSKGGNNQYLSQKIASELNCDIIAIKPRIDIRPLLIIGLTFGNKNLNVDITQYDKVILCGPIFMGKLIAPLNTFIKKHIKEIHKLIFVTVCGSSYDMKDKKYGHGLVFKEIKDLMGDKCIYCEALPITLIVPKNKIEDPQTIMNYRLTDESFKGEYLNKFKTFINHVKEM